MLEKRNKTGEAGWIAEEVFEDAAINLRSKCLAIDDQIAQGVLDLGDALEVYEVSMNDYLDFFIKEQGAQAEVRFHGLTATTKTLIRLKYAITYLNNSIILLRDSGSDIPITFDIKKLKDDVEIGLVKVLNE